MIIGNLDRETMGGDAGLQLEMTSYLMCLMFGAVPLSSPHALNGWKLSLCEADQFFKYEFLKMLIETPSLHLRHSVAHGILRSLVPHCRR
jgi:hypothetical protein